MYYRVLVASQRFHGKESLTYSCDQVLSAGQLVRVPLQRQIVLGVVMTETPKPAFATKAVTEDLPLQLPPSSTQLLEWLTRYYPAPLGSITELFTPPGLPKKLTLPEPLKTSAPHETLPPLTSEQQSSLKTIHENSGTSFLLHGDTGTGKTRVYAELIKQTLENGQSAIVLTPEIGLTQPLYETLRSVFGNQVLVTHSEMTPKQRREVWLQLVVDAQPKVLIGPRSALFYPVNDLGLIVMDEAHDTAYKQEQAPHYQTSRVAAQLAHLHNARFVMGTATPLVTDYFAFHQKGLPIIRMTKSALGDGEPAKVRIIDHRNKDDFSRSPWLANSLLEAMQSALARNEQSLLFLNRRGSARLVLCANCGWQALCPHCDVPLTFHQDHYLMRCHSCDYSDRVPTDCPVCGATELIFRNIGTKALEGEISRLFPEARVARFDRDTAAQERLHVQFEHLHSGDIDIVIGTQAIAKGFDLPKLALVGIIQADNGLQLPDYNASERTFQLLSQVSGRVGRGHRASQLFVQTFDPDSPLIKWALRKDYALFYTHEIEERRLFRFPPFYFLLKITCSRASGKSAQQACQKLADSLAEQFPGLIVEGPAPRFIEKIAGKYAWQLIIKASRRDTLLKVVATIPGNVTYDIDPNDLL